MKLSDISDTIDNAFLAAHLDPRSAGPAAASRHIRSALDAAGLTQSPSLSTALSTSPESIAIAPLVSHAPVVARPRAASSPEPADDVSVDVDSFSTHTYSNGQAQRNYKLFVPSSYTGVAMPLIVMLHGCKQSPDDFAAGTRMNEFAQSHGFLVAYPEQTARANGGNCWNWFNRHQQSRDDEEPSLIAGIVGQIAESHAVDPSKVFAAGLSAGGAMAAIVASAYPDVFKAIAVHSGLPVGAAHDVMSAFSAMHGRPDTPPHAVLRAVPTLVFHGESDSTVVPSNGRWVVHQAVHAFELDALQSLTMQVAIERGAAGHDCTVARYVDTSGRTQVESWFVAGAGHAWFGGSTAGSFTDANAPDASKQIVRFFLGH